MWSSFVFAVFGVQASVIYPGQAVRHIDLDPAQRVHMVEVVGALGMMTTLHLADDFDSSNVRCGACTLLASPTLASATEQNTSGVADARNWAMEVRPKERNVHLRPTHVPTADNPLPLFTTNLFITLDGGQAINVKLRLWDPVRDGACRPNADAAVVMHLPQTSLIFGQLAAQKLRLEQEQAQQVALMAQRWILEHLDADVRCRSLPFARPHRTDKTIVRLGRVCRAIGPKFQTYWAAFEVENDGQAPLVLQQAILEPQDGGAGATEAIPAYLSAERLAYGERLRAVAVYTTPTKSAEQAEFVLHVVFETTGRRSIDLDHLVFP